MWYCITREDRKPPYLTRPLLEPIKNSFLPSSLPLLPFWFSTLPSSSSLLYYLLNHFSPLPFHWHFFTFSPYTKQPSSVTPAFRTVLIPVSPLSRITRPHTVHSSTIQMKDAPGTWLPNYTVPHSTHNILHTHSWENLEVHVFKMNILTNNIT